MAEPEDDRAVTTVAPGRLRASDADREQLIGALKSAFAAGLLAADELDLRIARTLACRTYADLASVIAGLPAQPPRPAPARPLTRAGTVAGWAVCGLVASVVLTVVIVPAGTTKGVVAGTILLIYAVACLLAGLGTLAAGKLAPGRRVAAPGGMMWTKPSRDEADRGAAL